MFRKLFYLACLVLLFGVTAKTYAVDPNAEIPKLGVAPVIDGVMDSFWLYAEPHQITHKVAGTPTAANCSGSWRAIWDDQALYVFIDVNDDVLVANPDPVGNLGGTYNFDSVEVFANTGDRTITAWANTSPAAQYRFGWQPTNPSLGADHTWNVTTGIEYKFKTTGTNYSVEIKIPWTNLYLTGVTPSPAVGNLIGFEIQINDNDGGTTRVNQLAWIQVTNNAYSNPSVLGTVVLTLGSVGTATDPYPPDKAEDVYKNVILNWTPALTENITHNVYFGTDFNDVNEATVSSHSDVTASIGQLKDVNNFDPGTLELGTTYYWRVDEVNAPSSPGTNKGFVWSFTVEPIALKLPKERIVKVTAISSATKNDPNNTINEAGLDPNTDLHSTAGCWLSGNTDANNPVWIRYDFDRLYKIHEMFVWNYNVVASSKYGFNNVRIEYSTNNGASWTSLNTVTVFDKGPGKAGYAYGTLVPFNDVVASSVRITALSTWEITKYTKAGLAEVRFTIIPTYARIPSPGIGETDFSIDRVLSWRQGREADKHDVYISTDSAAVLNHSTPAHTVTVNNYSPLLDFGRTYYWSVTEVSNTMTPSRWVGDIWDFTTAEYGSLDDFEDYNGVPGREIYSFWLDGYESITNGSIIGLNNSPYVETTIVQHGKQSAPISYDNTGTLEPAATYSEVTRTFDTALNLKVNGADSLRLYYRGQAITFGELSGCIAMSGEGADIGGTSDQFRYAYKTLTGNGSITARVDSVENKNAATEAGIMIRNTIDANSAFAMANLIPNGTPSFQRRLTAGASAASTNLTAIGNPYWVKITRNGSTFTAQRSVDGTNWVSFETDANKPTTATITMGNSVLIGFAVSSHVADVIAAATFSGVATSGNISTGAWTVAPIGDATQADGLNTIDALYVVAEDSAGNKSKVFAPGDAVGSVVWMQLTVPYTQFTSVDMSKLKKLTIGVGDLAATAKGKGMIYIDNISYGHTIVK